MITEGERDKQGQRKKDRWMEKRSGRVGSWGTERRANKKRGGGESERGKEGNILFTVILRHTYGKGPFR